MRWMGFNVATCHVRGQIIKIGVSSETELYRANTYSTKEPETLDWLENNLRSGDVFFDIGANIGGYSLFAAKKVPSCTVYAFEPAFLNFSRLCNNIAMNKLANVTPCSLPLCDIEGFQYLILSSAEAGAAFNHLDESVTPSLSACQDRGLGFGTMRQGLLTTTLDALVDRHGLPFPALIKIDVAGGERKILDGAANVLKSGSLRSVLIELSAATEAELSQTIERIKDFGFCLTKISDWTDCREGIASRNYIFNKPRVLASTV